MLVVSFLTFRKKEPFVNVMVNEVPWKNFVIGVASRYEEIRIGKAAGAVLRRDAS